MPQKSPHKATKNGQLSSAQLSRVTKGKQLFLDVVDGRSAPARRYRDLVAEITSDLGGVSLLSEVQRQLIRRMAGHAVLAEQQEAAIVNGDPIDVEQYIALSSSLSRIASKIGLRRVARDITLQDVIQGEVE